MSCLCCLRGALLEFYCGLIANASFSANSKRELAVHPNFIRIAFAITAAAADNVNSVAERAELAPAVMSALAPDLVGWQFDAAVASALA